MKFAAALLLAVTVALAAHGQAKKSAKMDEVLKQLQNAASPADALPAAAYIRDHAAEAPALQLFVAAMVSLGSQQLEDAAFLFYVAQLRTRHDLMRYPPKGTGADSPSVLFAALNQQLGAEVNPAVMRDPKALAAVVKRVESWSPATPAGYDPGWPYNPGKPDEAKQVFATQKAAFSNQFGALSALLSDPQYFAAFKTVQDYNFSTAAEMQDAKRKKAKEAAEATMLDIERRRGLEGLYFRKP